MNKKGNLSKNAVRGGTGPARFKTSYMQFFHRLVPRQLLFDDHSYNHRAHFFVQRTMLADTMIEVVSRNVYLSYKDFTSAVADASNLRDKEATNKEEK